MNLLALQLNNGTGIDADGTEKQVCKQFKTDDPGSSLVEKGEAPILNHSTYSDILT